MFMVSAPFSALAVRWVGCSGYRYHREAGCNGLVCEGFPTCEWFVGFAIGSPRLAAFGGAVAGCAAPRGPGRVRGRGPERRGEKMIARSHLYVPGNAPGKLGKALG